MTGITSLIILGFFTTLSILIMPDKGITLYFVTVSKFQWKVLVAMGVALISYSILMRPKKKRDPLISFSNVDKMKAMVVNYYGPQSMEMATIFRPMVTKPNEVLIKVRAVSINPIDIAVKEGRGRTLLEAKREEFGYSNEFPLVVGRDCSGEVVEIGSNVTKFKKGDEVWTSSGVFQTPGTLAEYFLTQQQHISKKPSNLDHTQAASIPYVANTSWKAIQSTGLNAEKLRGKRVLVMAGTGGVGSFCIQLFKAWGCHVTTTCSYSGMKMVEELGADESIDYHTEDLVKYMDGKEKFDLVLCTRGGKDTFTSCLSVCRSGGSVVTLVTPFLGNMDKYGFVLGNIKTLVDWASIYYVQKFLYNRNFQYSFHLPSGSFLAEVAELVESGKVRPCIDNVNDFIDTNTSFDDLKVGHARGKFVVVISDE